MRWLASEDMRAHPSCGRQVDKRAALEHFGLSTLKPVLLVVGGSLGTRTLNEMMKRHVERIVSLGSIQVIWQTGKYYSREMDNFMSGKDDTGIWHGAFIDRMDYAYAAADIVISRSGACTVSELCIAGKPTIFVPSPNVAEDHQTKNAMALVEQNAAKMVPDSAAPQQAIPLAEKMLEEPDVLAALSCNISKLAITDSADRVAAEIEKVIGLKHVSSKMSECK